MKEEVVVLYVTKAAKNALMHLDTKTPMYKIASELILAGIAQRK
jgi:hypothetical protein